MTGNPYIDRSPFYALYWSDLRSRMPFVTNMQLLEAAEILSAQLNELFTVKSREMAWAYEEADKKRAATQRDDTSPTPPASRPDAG